MVRLLTITLTGLLASTVPASAPAVVIDFDGLPEGITVTNQFPEATFSSDPGFENRTLSFPGGTSQPNILCTAAVGGGLTCTNTTNVDFTTPVANLTFLGTGDTNVGVSAKVDVYVNDVFTSTEDFVTDGSVFMPDLMDLRAFSNVTRVVIHSIIDPGGLGWDDFSFDLVPVSVDESTWGQIKGLYR